jgi:hypothetical protein
MRSAMYPGTDAIRSAFRCRVMEIAPGLLIVRHQSWCNRTSSDAISASPASQCLLMSPPHSYDASLDQK